MADYCRNPNISSEYKCGQLLKLSGAADISYLPLPPTRAFLSVHACKAARASSVGWDPLTKLVTDHQYHV